MGRAARSFGSLADTAVVSLGNFGVSWVGAQQLPLAGFGELAMCSTAALIVAGAVKAFAVDPLTLGYAALDGVRRDEAARRVLATSGGLAGAVSVVLLLAALVFGPYAGLLAVLAAVLPAIVVLDSLRWIAYAEGRVTRALAGSVTCASATAIGMVALALLGRPTSSAMLAVWGGAAVLGVLVSSVLTGRRPDPAGVRSWITSEYRVGVPSLIDYGLSQATGLGGGLLIAALADAEQYGALRLAMLPFAAVQLVFVAAIAATQPALVIQVAGGRASEARKLAVRVAVACVALVAVVAVMLMVVPDGLLSRLLGEHWVGAAGLVPLVALGLALSAVTVGFGPYLRARGLLRYEVWIKTIAAPLTFAAIVAGCLVDGVAGGALGQAVGLLLVAAGLAVKTIRLPAAVPVAAAGATR